IKAKDPLAELRSFFLKWNVPPYVCVAEADNELFIHTDNTSYLQLLLEEIKSCDSLKLVEWIYDTVSGMPVQQFILPLSQKKAETFKQACNGETTNNIARTFVPGSEWVYFKI